MGRPWDFKNTHINIQQKNIFLHVIIHVYKEYITTGKTAVKPQNRITCINIWNKSVVNIQSTKFQI